MYGLLPRHVHRFEFAGHGAGTLLFECRAPLAGGKSCEDYDLLPCADCVELDPDHVAMFAHLLQPCAVCQRWGDAYCGTHLELDRLIVCPNCCAWECCR